ncbi:hypothetical protein ACS0TY_008541 [Phlomoides rotata]
MRISGILIRKSRSRIWISKGKGKRTQKLFIMENLADGPNSDAMEVKNNKRKRGRGRIKKISKEAAAEENKITEASEIVNEEKPQLKKRKSRRRKSKPKKVEIGEIEEEGINHNETGSTGLQLVVITDQSIVRYVRGRGRSRKRCKEAAVEEKRITEASEIVNEEKPQLKKRKSRRQKNKPKKVEIGEIKEEGLDHSETGSTGLQLVVITDASIVRYVRGRGRSRKRSKEAAVEEKKIPEASEIVNEEKPQLKKRTSKVEIGEIREEGLDHNETGSTGLQLAVITDESIVRKNEETSLKVYAEGIRYYCTEDDIRSYFEGFGTITSFDCMTFPDSEKFRGIAIITYKTEAAAKRALALDGSNLGGLFLKIQPYKSATSDKFPSFSPSVVDGYNSIYVGNLSLDTTEDDLWKLFADCAVASIRFSEDKEMGEFEGYAHVDFADGLSLHTALKLDQTIVHGRFVSISCAVSKNATGTKLIPLLKDNQEDSGKKEYTTTLEATPNDNEVDKINVSVVKNQVTSSGTNDVCSKIRRQTCYECGERGHLRLACPKKVAANLTIPGQMIVSSEKGIGTMLIPYNQEDRWKKGNTTTLEATLIDKEVDRSNVSVVENQVISSGTNALSSKKRWRSCYECGECGHLSPSCPKKLAADSTNPDDCGKKRKFTKFEVTPRYNEIDRYNVSLVVENQVTSSGTNAHSSKIWKRTCYKCGECGHLSSSCPKRLAVDSTNPDNHDRGKGKLTKFEAVPPRNYNVSSKVWKRAGYKCRERGHLSSSCPKELAVYSTNPDNHDDRGKGKLTKFEAMPPRNYNVSSKIWKRCYKCRERGHLSSSCPKELAVYSTNPDNHDRGKGKLTKFEAVPPRNYNVSSKVWKRAGYKCRERGHLSSSCPKELAVYSTNPVVENQVTSSGTCYKCKERGHRMSSCPKTLAANSTNPVTAGKILPINWHGCTSSVNSIPVGTTSAWIPVRPTLVRWLLPPNPWIKLNTDGSFNRNTGVASGGGLIRDHSGDLQLAFCMPLEATSSFDAELQALLYGLYLARQFNRPVWIELDALEVVRLLDTDRPGAWHIQHTLAHVRALMAQIQQTWITHIFREGNRPADYMATMGFGSHALHIVYPHSAPKNFLELVSMDRIGYPSFRVKY